VAYPAKLLQTRFGKQLKEIAARPRELTGYAFQRKGHLTVAEPLLRRGQVVNKVTGTDEKLMTVTAVISSIERDRVGDEVVPEGCDLTNFALNPTVFFGHQSIPFPVGVAEDPSGKLTVVIEPGKRIISTTYFHDHTIEALQVFTLCVKRILRGTSIGFNPTGEPERLGEIEGNVYAGYRYGQWELLEYSHVGVPAHPRAVIIDMPSTELLRSMAEYAELVRAELSRDRIAGKRIAEPIRKALEPLAEAKPAWSTGATLKNKKETIIMATKAKVPAKKSAAAPVATKVAPKPAAKAAPKVAAKPTKKTGRKDGASSGSGAAGGYALPPADHKRIKAAIAKVAKTHEDEAGDVHDFLYHPTKQEAYHCHSEDADATHLEAVKEDLDNIKGVEGVVQSSERPELEEEYDLVHSKADAIAEGDGQADEGKEAEEEMEDAENKEAEEEESDEAEDETNKFGGTAGTPATGAGGGSVTLAAGNGADDVDGAGKEEEEDEESNPRGDDTPVAAHGAEYAAMCLHQLQEVLPHMEPEVAEFFHGIHEQIHEWATGRYPDHEFEAGDADGDNDGDAAAENEEEEEEEQDEAEESDEESDADEEDTEEDMDDRYGMHRSAAGKRKGKSKLKGKRRVPKQALGVINEAAGHLLDMSLIEDGSFGKLHRAACKLHANELMGVHRGLAGDGAVPTNDSADVGDGAAPTGDSINVGDGAAVVSGKSTKGQIQDALAELRRANDGLDKSFYRLTGKKIGSKAAK
jgi:hypothetical protein